MKKNLFFTLVTACFPGFGQMYYGYMRRGTSLALWFWGTIFISSFWGMGPLGLVLPVIWAYSFFDTFNIRSLSPEQYAAFGDDYLPNSDWMRQIRLEKMMSGGRRKMLGWALIAFGVILLYNTIFSRLIWKLYEYIPFLASFIEIIPSLFIAGVVILLGLYVLRGKASGAKTRDDEDYSWKPTQPTQPQPTEWDTRQTPAPVPTWDFAATPTAPEAPEAPVVPPAPEAPMPEVPSPEAPASIVLSLTDEAVAEEAAETPVAEAKTEENTATETPGATEEIASANAPQETPDEDKKASGKKGKKKENDTEEG